MHKYHILQKALTVLATCAMVYLFFVQARIVLRPMQLHIDPTQVAFGYDGIGITGKVYKDKGVTALSGVTVTVSVNGAAAYATGETDVTGAYVISPLAITGGDIVTIFLDNESQDAVLVVTSSTGALAGKGYTASGYDLYQSQLIVRTDSGSVSMTNTNLAKADNSGDSDIAAIYSVDASNTLQVQGDMGLFVWSGTTIYVPGADIITHDLDVRGTLTMSTNDLTASGSVSASGTLTTSGDIYLKSTGTSETLSFYGNSVDDLIIDNGLIAYWKFDEGFKSSTSGSSITALSGALTNMSGSGWTASASSGTIFYNPYALDLDGSDDYVDFGDNLDVGDGIKRTFTGWFNRKSYTTDDVILAKRNGVASGDTGYILYIDDSDDKLHFEVSDGSQEYELKSTSTFLAEGWFHYAVVWDPAAAKNSFIFINGTDDSTTKTGTIGNIDDLSNAVSLRVGAESDSANYFHGRIDDVRMYNRAFTGSEIVSLANGRKATGSGTYILGSRLFVGGDLKIFGGTLDVKNGSNYPINVSGDLYVHGDLYTQSGTVTLEGTGQTLFGSTHFRHFAKTVTSGNTITFESQTEQTFSGSLVMHGATNNLLSIRSSRSGSASYLILDGSGAQTLKFLNVQDSNALTGATLTCTTGCVDSGNNTNWAFLGECGDGVKNTGEACDDGNTSNLDGCLNTCVVAICGDEFINAGAETCDPPDGDICLANCQLKDAGAGTGGGSRTSVSLSKGSYYKRPAPPPGCGNRIWQPELGEECDDGSILNGVGTCSHDCKRLYCGDGIVSTYNGEECEPVAASSQGNVSVFRLATCGEICSVPQVLSSGRMVAGCKRVFLPPCVSIQSVAVITSKPARCGNGVLDSGEECDTGGICKGGPLDKTIWEDEATADSCDKTGGIPYAVSGDGCSRFCQIEFCGDGEVQEKGPDNVAGTNDDELCDNGKICSLSKLPCRKDAECALDERCEFDADKNHDCTDQCRWQWSPKVSASITKNTMGSSGSPSVPILLTLLLTTGAMGWTWIRRREREAKRCSCSI